MSETREIKITPEFLELYRAARLRWDKWMSNDKLHYYEILPLSRFFETMDQLLEEGNNGDHH